MVHFPFECAAPPYSAPRVPPAYPDLISPTDHSLSTLSRVLNLLSQPWVRTFLLSPDPVHLPILTSPLVASKAVSLRVNEHFIARAPNSTASYAAQLHGRSLLIPAFSAEGLTLGVGVKHMDFVLPNTASSSNPTPQSNLIPDPSVAVAAAAASSHSHSNYSNDPYTSHTPFHSTTNSLSPQLSIASNHLSCPEQTAAVAPPASNQPTLSEPDPIREHMRFVGDVNSSDYLIVRHRRDSPNLFLELFHPISATRRRRCVLTFDAQLLRMLLLSPDASDCFSNQGIPDATKARIAAAAAATPQIPQQIMDRPIPVPSSMSVAEPLSLPLDSFDSTSTELSPLSPISPPRKRRAITNPHSLTTSFPDPMTTSAAVGAPASAYPPRTGAATPQTLHAALKLIQIIDEGRDCQTCGALLRPVCECPVRTSAPAHALDPSAAHTSLMRLAGAFHGVEVMLAFVEGAAVASAELGSRFTVNFGRERELLTSLVDWGVRDGLVGVGVQPRRFALPAAVARAARDMEQQRYGLFGSDLDNIDDDEPEVAGVQVEVLPDGQLNTEIHSQIGMGTQSGYVVEPYNDSEWRATQQQRQIQQQGLLVENGSGGERSATPPQLRVESDGGMDTGEGEAEVRARTKAEIRREKNRQSAMRCNREKKMRSDQLKKELAEARSVLERLRRKEAHLRIDNSRLRGMIRKR